MSPTRRFIMSNYRPPKSIEDLLEAKGYKFPKDHFRDYWILRNVRPLFYRQCGQLGQCLTTGRGIEFYLNEYEETPVKIDFDGRPTTLWYFRNSIYSDDKEAWLNG